MDQEEKLFCPFIQDTCRGDTCMLYRRSEESMVKKCAFAVIAEQLDILASRDKGGKSSLL